MTKANIVETVYEKVGGFSKKEITELLQLKSEMILWVMPIGYEKTAK